MSDIRIPDIGDVESVQVIELCVSPGDEVGPDDPLIVIESDKASMEVPAGVSGRIEELLVKEGDEVSEGDVIARVTDAEGDGGTSEADDTEAAAATAAEDSAAEAADETGRKADQDATAAGSKETSGQSSAQPGSADARNADRTEEAVDVVVPDIGDVDEVVVIEVGVRPGAEIGADDLVVVVESDKASMEIPAGRAGVVRDVHVAEGDKVREGDRLLTLTVTVEAGVSEAGAASPRAATGDDAGEESETQSAAARSSAAVPAMDRQPPAPPSAESQEGEADSAGARIYAGPAVRRMARELGVPLARVEGSGSGGRIVKEDVQTFVKKQLSAEATGGGAIPALPAEDFSKYGRVSEQPLGRMREVGAANLHRSWLNVVHVTQHDEADVTDMEAFRRELKAEAEQRGIKITPLAFLIRACCRMLKEFPTFNASLSPDGKQYILKHYYHIGLAVDTEQGLLVPVLRDADRKGIWELSEEIADLAERARQRKLKPDELRGGSFSISSLGPQGGTGFTPIVNAPEVAILGVSKLATRPQWNGSEFVPRQMLPLSLSYDHRAINGAEAGRFVTELCRLLGDLRRLLL